MASNASAGGAASSAASSSGSTGTLISDEQALMQLRAWQIEPHSIEYDVKGERRATEGVHGRTCWSHACFEGRVDMLEW